MTDIASYGRFCRGVLAAVWLLGFSGCGLGVLLTAIFYPGEYCQLPGACGESGTLLANFRNWAIAEIQGERSPHFPWHAGAIQRGFAFSAVDGLVLYAATDMGLRVYDGRDFLEPFQTISISDCSSMEDVVVMPDGHVVVSCPPAGRLVKIAPGSSSEVESFQCCQNVEAGFEPRAIALAPDGRLLAGTKQIYAFDGTTGESLGVVVESGVEGATTYDDRIFGPDGNLLVSANPDIGVLEFDGETFEFIRVLIPGGPEGVPHPRALAFDDEGHLFVGGGVTPLVVEFDGKTGEKLGVILESEYVGSIDHMAFRP